MRKSILLFTTILLLMLTSCKDRSNEYIYTDGDQKVIIELPEGQRQILSGQENELRVTFENIDRKTATFSTAGLVIKSTDGPQTTIVTQTPTKLQELNKEVVVTIGYIKNGEKVFKSVKLPVK